MSPDHKILLGRRTALRARPAEQGRRMSATHSNTRCPEQTEALPITLCPTPIHRRQATILGSHKQQSGSSLPQTSPTTSCPTPTGHPGNTTSRSHDNPTTNTHAPKPPEHPPHRRGAARCALSAHTPFNFVRFVTPPLQSDRLPLLNTHAHGRILSRASSP